MIYHEMLNVMKMQSSLADNKFSVTTGKLIAYDPANYLGMVEFFAADIDENSQPSAWLPISSVWSGNGWGLFAAPPIGSICEVHFQEGNLQNGYINNSFYNNITAQPLNVPSGEFWIVHQNGTFIKITNDGKVELNGNVEIDLTAPTINITATGTVNIEAPNVNIGAHGGSFTALLTGLASAIYNSHTHNILSPSITDIPNQQFTSGEETTNVKAT